MTSDVVLDEPRKIRVALAQMLVEGGRKSANLERAEKYVRDAAAKNAAIVVLPEALDLGWTHPFALEEAGPIPGGECCERLRAAARSARVYVCAGLVERQKNQAFNSAVLISPEGEILLVHRKLNELEIGHEYYAQGDRLCVAKTPIGVIGVMICADAFARGQIVGRTLGLMGAHLILSPSAWAVPADHDNARDPYGRLWLDNYRPVARDYRLWIVGVSNVGHITAGPWKGQMCIGCSLVVGPDGEQVLMGPYGPKAEALLTVDVMLQPRPARGNGWERFWRSQSK